MAVPAGLHLPVDSPRSRDLGRTPGTSRQSLECRLHADGDKEKTEELALQKERERVSASAELAFFVFLQSLTLEG